MATTLPQFTKAVDDAFTETWYEIREDAIDNILDATVTTALLRDMGSFVTQVGGQDITRTVKYGNQRGTAVDKGDVLPSGEPKLETAARWDWRYIAGHVQRSIFDDQKNNGRFMIKSYVAKRLQDMRDGLEQDIEERFLAAQVTDESGKLIQSLNDMVPTTAADRILNTYGTINRPTAYDVSGSTAGLSQPSTGNTWWGARYFRGNDPYEANFVDDLRTFFNSVGRQKQSPDLILCDQNLFEAYEAIAVDVSQIIKEADTRIADLGFDLLRCKGARMAWSEDMTANHALLLHTPSIEVVYDPQLWFEMTEFKPIPFQAERIAHILLVMNTVCGQLRRLGRLHYANI